VEIPDTIGVAGAGTMGGGIAQLACLCGARTLLHDPAEGAVERAITRIERRLAHEVSRGRLSEAAAAEAGDRLQGAGSLSELAPCGLVIEAAPESLALKRALLAELSEEVVDERCVLATNTSSLLVTEIAAAVRVPERVVGMHFFNPPPAMAAMELVAGVASSPHAIAVARATGEAMGKVVIDAQDGPGFLVNRCNRPFTLEALRLLGERVAEAKQIDRICRLGGGFRMGPFELMDLVGIDVNLAVARSMFEQGFSEPRWRPSPIPVRLVAAGRLGRKSGRGYYEYPASGAETAGPGSGAAHRDPDGEPPARGGGGDRTVDIAGEGQLAIELRELAAEAGWSVADRDGVRQEEPYLVIDAGAPGEPRPVAAAAPGPRAISCAAGSLARLDASGAAVGFHVLPPLRGAHLIELARGAESPTASIEACEHFFGTLGMHTAWVGDAPGLVLGRFVSQLVNEAAFALGEGVGTADDIDAGVINALNYPRGILRWADEIGLDVILGVLDALYEERRDERYRPAPLLTALVWSGRLGARTGEGFFRWAPEGARPSGDRGAASGGG
jgi:3-hydroxybutyryl-CoA dehydrogenase